MNKDVRKLFAEMVGVSLNSDQVNVLAQTFNRAFDIREATGFGPSIAIPGHAAAEALIHFLKTEENAVQFFERMLDREGKFVYDGNLKITYRDDFINLLAQRKWVFDPDSRRFLRDQFHAEQLNFLKSIELIDLRKGVDVTALRAQIREQAERLKLEDLTWQVTLRLYRLNDDVNHLIRDLLALLLRKQNLEPLADRLYTALNELSINASKATYKVLFQKHVTDPEGIDPVHEYPRLAARFRQELEENGDKRVSQFAEQDDRFFEVHLKSAPTHIALWATNYTPIQRREKLRLLKRLNYSLSEQNLEEIEHDSEREGAGLGINLVLSIIGKISPEQHPLKPVFYQDRTKMGFVLKRGDLETALR